MKKKIQQISETYTYTYQGQTQQIYLDVHISYKEGTISLIKTPNNDMINPKQFMFSGRGLAYMKGWQDILDGMKEAIADATKRLEKYKEETTGEIADGILEIQDFRFAPPIKKKGKKE